MRAFETLVCHVPRSGSPDPTENHVSETLKPVCPPEKLTCSATRTDACRRLPTLMSADRTRVELPRMKTGPMARRLLLRACHGLRHPGRDPGGNGGDRRAPRERGPVVDMERDEIPVVVAGPGRRHECAVTYAVVPTLPVVVRVIESEPEAPAGVPDNGAGDAWALGLGLGGTEIFSVPAPCRKRSIAMPVGTAWAPLRDHRVRGLPDPVELGSAIHLGQQSPQD